MVLRRVIRRGPVQRHRAQERTAGGVDRETPDAAIAELLGQPQPRPPTRILAHVGGQDRLAGRGGQAAGKRVGTDAEAVDRARVGVVHADDVMQSGAVVARDIERGTHAIVELRGHGASEDAQRFGERRVGERGLRRFLLRRQPHFALAQRGVGVVAFEQVGGLAGEDVEKSQLVFAGLVRLVPVRGEHADQLATARDQRRALRCEDAGVGVHAASLRGQAFVAGYVGRDGAAALLQRPGA